MFCRNCGNPMDPNAAVCVRCGCAKGTGVSYCPNCGRPTLPGAAACTTCGCGLAVATAESKSKLVAGLLGLFLGCYGIHNFYLGYTSRAVTQLVVSLAGLFVTCGLATIGIGVWTLIESIQILSGHISTDANGVPLKD